MDVIDAPMIPSDFIDPETMGELNRVVQEAIDAQVEALTTPLYPRWYKDSDYPEPDPGDAFSKVKVLEGEFGSLRSQIHEDYRTLRMETFGAFGDFNPDDDDAWIDSGIMSEVELIAYQLADSDLSFDAPVTTMADEDASERKIDFAAACYEDAKRQHSTSGHGSLPLDKARTLLTTGRLAWHATLNLDAEEGEMPFNETLLDPATCFPVFENKRGLKTMARVYTTTVADAVGAFSTADNPLDYMYEERGPDGKFRTKYRPHQTATVTEYWDRRWRIVWINTEVVLGPVPHDYGFVPFVYKLGGLGMPGYMSDPTTMRSSDLDRISVGQSWNPRDVSNPNKGMSLVRLLRTPHMLREAVLTKIMTGFDKSMNPPTDVYMDDMTYPQGTPERSNEKNAVNPVKMGRQEFRVQDVDPSPQLMNVMLAGAEENVGRLKLPPTAHGMNDKSNVSGYATNSLNESGQVKLVPHKKVLEEFETECMEMRMRMFRDWGHLVQQGEYGTQGELTVPYSDVDAEGPRAFLLHPHDLRNTGTRMKVRMRSLSVQMLGVTGNAVNILMSAGLMDKMSALRLLEDPNPHKTLRRIRMDQMLEDPVVQEMRAIEALREQGLHEQADYFAMRKAGEGAVAPGSPPPPQEEGGGSPVGTVVGDSNAQYGFGPGEGSGPQGPIGPRGPMVDME